MGVGAAERQSKKKENNERGRGRGGGYPGKGEPTKVEGFNVEGGGKREDHLCWKNGLEKKGWTQTQKKGGRLKGRGAIQKKRQLPGVTSNWSLKANPRGRMEKA